MLPQRYASMPLRAGNRALIFDFAQETSLDQ